MILGLGSDIIDIRRIEKAFAQFGARFENRIFTRAEQQVALSRKPAGSKIVAGFYAKRFAAKEACAKALGTGMKNISWHELEVVSLASGAPTMQLHGKALIVLQSLTPPGHHAFIHLSLSDDYPYAYAQAILSAEMK